MDDRVSFLLKMDGSASVTFETFNLRIPLFFKSCGTTDMDLYDRKCIINLYYACLSKESKITVETILQNSTVTDYSFIQCFACPNAEEYYQFLLLSLM